MCSWRTREFFRDIGRNLKFYFKTYSSYTKEKKQDYKKYAKSIRQTRRNVRKIMREYGPWEYGYLLDIINCVIKNWRDYYEIGYNVSAMEAKDSWEECKDYPTRLEIAEHLIDLYEQYQKAIMVLDATPNEHELLQEFFEYFGKWVVYMWD